MTLVCYQPTALPWEGRRDGNDPASLRWHQYIQTTDISRVSLPALKQGQKGIALLGFVSDEGVRRNKGRTGAAAGPAMIRKMCASFPVHFDDHLLVDAGDIVCEDNQLEMAQEALSATVHYLLQQGYLPVLLGGGHEIAYAHERGIRRYTGSTQQLGIINFDAHFDLRIPASAGISSGSGFWQLAQDCEAQSRAFHYLALGIQAHSNTAQLFRTAAELNVLYIPADAFHSQDRNTLRNAISTSLEQTDAIYLTIDLDVFAAPFAPGVSAVAYNGILPGGMFMECLRIILQSGKVAGIDIAELNPSFDVDNHTAKLGAALVFEAVMQRTR